MDLVILYAALLIVLANILLMLAFIAKRCRAWLLLRAATKELQSGKYLVETAQLKLEILNPLRLWVDVTLLDEWGGPDSFLETLDEGIKTFALELEKVSSALHTECGRNALKLLVEKMSARWFAMSSMIASVRS